MDQNQHNREHNQRTHQIISEPSISSDYEPSISYEPTAWVGVDVSKNTLDVFLLAADGKTASGSFGNEKKGHAALLKWLQRIAPKEQFHFCLEATGAYSTQIALFLVEKKQRVSVVNPYRVKHAAIACAAGNKTDQADAKVLAHYCRKEQPAPWRLAAAPVRELVVMVRHLETLKLQRAQQKNRLSEPGLLPVVQKSLQDLVSHLDEQITQIQEQIDRHIDNDPDLKADHALLLTIPGVASVTAVTILAELPDVREFINAEAAAAYAGLNPRQHRSGSSVHQQTRLSKRGNSRLRKALYFPAIVACRFNPLVKGLADRLTDRKKTRMCVVGAAMRKLLMIAYGVLRSRQPFQVDYISPKNAAMANA